MKMGNYRCYKAFPSYKLSLHIKNLSFKDIIRSRNDLEPILEFKGSIQNLQKEHQ